MLNIKAVNKAKAHQAADSEGVNSRRAKANDWVDHFANLGRLKHDKPSEAQIDEIDLQVKDVGRVAALVARVFALWPMPEKATRLPQAKVVRLGTSKKTRHEWQRTEGRWQCRWCFSKALTSDAAKRRGRDKCEVRAKDVELAQQLDKARHMMLEVRFSDARLLICRVCDNYVQFAKRYIVETGGGKLAGHGQIVLSLLARSMHPNGRSNDMFTEVMEAVSGRPFSERRLGGRLLK